MRIHTLKDILIVILLAVLVTMTCLQDSDILKLKHRVFMLEGGLQYVYGGLRSLLNGSGSTQGGLVLAEGGLDLRYFRAASAHLMISRSDNQGPITLIDKVRGAAVFVSDNVLLTAKHTLENRTGLSGVQVIADGQTYTAVEVLEDSDDDLAVVVIAGRIGPFLELGPQPSLGDNLICIGSPVYSPRQLIISWGRVSNENWNNRFIYDGFVAPGCSGGPIIANGKVVGIVKARLDNLRTCPLGFAVPVDRLDPSLMARIR